MSIRVGLLGLNYGAQVHLPAFRANSRYTVVAVCARTPGRAETFAREHGIPRWYTDARRMFASNLDLISVATPPVTHAGYAAAALAAGKHVLLEVAFTANVPDARVLLDMARDHSRVGAAAYILHYVPTLRHVSDLLSQGALGRLRLVHMDFFSGFLAKPGSEYGWIWDAENGGGVLAGFVAHGLDLVRRWCGPVRSVDATLATLAEAGEAARLLPGGSTGNDTGQVALQFDDDRLATFNFSAITAQAQTQFALHGTGASLLVQGFGDEASLLPWGEATPRPIYAPAAYLEETRGADGLAGGFQLFLDRLAVALTGGAPPPDLPTFADALEVQRVLDAAHLSAREHRRVTIAEVG